MEAARRFTGVHPRKVKEEWVYPHAVDGLAAAHLQLIEYAVAPHPVYFGVGRRLRSHNPKRRDYGKEGGRGHH